MRMATQPPNAALQLRRAITIPAERTRLLEKHAIAPSAASAYAARTSTYSMLEVFLEESLMTSLTFTLGIIRGFLRRGRRITPLLRRVRLRTSPAAICSAPSCDSCSLILLRAFTPLRNVPKDSGRIDYICDAKSPGLHRRSLGRWHIKLL